MAVTPPQPAMRTKTPICATSSAGAGQRALEIAAAGGHNLLLIGPPGTGKTMLASRLTGLLPPLTEPEALEAWRSPACNTLF